MSTRLLTLNNIPISSKLEMSLIDSLALCSIPKNALHISLNFQNTKYLTKQQGSHPLEVHFCRDNLNSPWYITMLASYSYPYEGGLNMEVELYFNFKQGWFYQPDIQYCNIKQPRIIKLFATWDKAISNSLKGDDFDQLKFTTLSKQTM